MHAGLRRLRAQSAVASGGRRTRGALCGIRRTEPDLRMPRGNPQALFRRATRCELGDLGERFIRRQQPGLEAQLANFADEIAYNNHDVDDGIRAGLISVEQLLEVPLFAGYHAEVCARYPELAGRRLVLRDPAAHDQPPGDRPDRLLGGAAARGEESSRSAEVRAAPAPLIGFSEATRELNLRPQAISARAGVQALQGPAHDDQGASGRERPVRCVLRRSGLDAGGTSRRRRAPEAARGRPAAPARWPITSPA